VHLKLHLPETLGDGFIAVDSLPVKILYMKTNHEIQRYGCSN